MELRIKDMTNKTMTNEQAIEIIQSNTPDKRYSVLRDALTLAVKALRMTSRKMDKEKREQKEECRTE